jgi:hypothetical protein
MSLPAINMKIKILIIMGFLSALFGTKKSQGQNQIVEIDGKKIEIVKSENPIESNYGLKDLSQEHLDHFKDLLERAQIFIKKYNDSRLPESIYDSRTLDFVLEKWKLNESNDKESQEEVIEIIGCAFGQDIVKELNCEWKLLTDEYGTDYTVIHKKYKINGFPFSSVLKAIEENRNGSLYDIKLVLKKNILDAESGADFDKRK